MASEFERTEAQTAQADRIIEGKPLGAIDALSLGTIRTDAKSSLGALEEAAKQLITVVGFSQTVYFAAISFSDVRTFEKHFGLWEHTLLAVALALPLLLWICSLAFAILVFMPEHYMTNLGSPDLGKEDHEGIVQCKRKRLQKAYLALLGGFIPLLINVIVYLMFIPVVAK